MRHFSADAACRSASERPGSAGPRHKLPHSAISLRARFGRLSLMLGVYAAIGTAGIPLAAIAAPHHPAHTGHGGAAPAAAAVHGVKPGRSSRVFAPHAAHAAARRSRDTRMAGVSRPAHPGRSAGPIQAATPGGVRSAGAMHRGVVPLANTTWDDPAMPPAIRDAIQTAARESGVDPHLLTAIAWRESRFDPNALNIGP